MCSLRQINAFTLETQLRLCLCHLYVAAILGNGPTTIRDRASLLLQMERVRKMLQRISECLGGLPEGNQECRADVRMSMCVLMALTGALES